MWDWRKWERRRLVNFYFIAFSGIMRTSIANFLLFRRFWEKRKEEFLRKGGGKGAMALLELSCLFFFYLNPSSFLHPSLRSQVLEVWSIDYMDPASWPRAVCTLCCPDNPLTLTIFVQHRHFFSSIIFFFFSSTCHQYLRFLQRVLW